jgi:hypothetical protein
MKGGLRNQLHCQGRVKRGGLPGFDIGKPIDIIVKSLPYVIHR